MCNLPAPNYQPLKPWRFFAPGIVWFLLWGTPTKIPGGANCTFLKMQDHRPLPARMGSRAPPRRDDKTFKLLAPGFVFSYAAKPRPAAIAHLCAMVTTQTKSRSHLSSVASRASPEGYSHPPHKNMLLHQWNTLFTAFYFSPTRRAFYSPWSASRSTTTRAVLRRQVDQHHPRLVHTEAVSQ